MTEKQKNKNGETQQFTKSFVMKILFVILVIPLFFSTYYIFSAYALKSFFSILMIVFLIGLIVFLISISFKALSIAVRIRDKIIILSIMPTLLLNILLGYMPLLIAPIMFIIVTVYAILLMLKYEMINLPKILILLGLASIFTINAIIAQGYIMLVFKIEDNLQANAQHYVLLSRTSLGDPTFIFFHECNSIGIMCQEIHAPRDYYDNQRDNFYLEIDAENDFIINVLVNDEVVYQHILE